MRAGLDHEVRLCEPCPFRMARTRHARIGRMPDTESSDVLANLPAGRPTRRSTRRAAPADGAGVSTPAKPASAATKSTAAAKPRATAAKTTAATKAKATTAKATPAKAKPASTTAAKAKAVTAAKPKASPTKARASAAKAKPAAGKAQSAAAARTKPTAANAKAPAATKAKTAATAKTTAAAKAKTPAKATASATKAASTPRQPSTGRRPRLATPPEGRRGDFSAGSTHRARKVTTNRPWLPSSGFALPESKERPPVGLALEGLAAALGDVARVSIGIVQSLTVKRRSDELEAPDGDQEPTKS